MCIYHMRNFPQEHAQIKCKMYIYLCKLYIAAICIYFYDWHLYKSLTGKMFRYKLYKL